MRHATLDGSWGNSGMDGDGMGFARSHRNVNMFSAGVVDPSSSDERFFG